MTRGTWPHLRLGSAPDSWGVWFPDDEYQPPWWRFLDELVEAGYQWLELGPYGYLPTDPQQLADELGARGLQVSGGTTFGNLHQPEAWDGTLAQVRRVAALTAAVGAEHVVLIPPMYRDEKTGERASPVILDDDAWATMHRNATELGKILLREYGVRLCVHPHADSYVQTQPEIERLLAGTDPEYVWLCLDTGHVAYGGGDAVGLIRRRPERVGYVHLKQMDPEVLAQVRAEDLSFAEAVRRGVCVEPPGGVPNPDDVVDALGELNHELFVIVEHDLYPCEPDVPLPIAARTRAYLNGCGLT